MFVDASRFGVGAPLAQVDPEMKKHRSLAFISKSWMPTQQA
jgi:hypothetical protein